MSNNFDNQYYIGENGFEAFADYLKFSDEERAARRAALENSYMPFRVSDHFARAIKSAAESDRGSLLNIVLPPKGMGEFKGRFDPYGNLKYSADATAFLQNKYPRTLLVHITDYCTAHCQFCYKVNEIKVSHASAASAEKKIDAALEFLDSHPLVDNILFTGGDPGSIKPFLLQRYIKRLIAHPNIRVLRFATKSVVFDPFLLRDQSLLDLFKEIHKDPAKQVSVIAQINHPAEITQETAETLRMLRQTDVLVRGQPAVIGGVNEDWTTLARLMRAFNDHRIVSYYFTLFMPVRGVEQYGVKIHDGHRAFQTATGDVNGLEKKGVLLISHDYGKIEVVGFRTTASGGKKIALRWHEVVPIEYLSSDVIQALPHQMGDFFELDYPQDGVYSFDQLLAYNGLSHEGAANIAAAE